MASPDEPWAQFRTLVAQSEYADQLQPLVGIIDRAHVAALDRIEAMVALVQLVSTLEWSPAMKEAREAVANALRTLLHQLHAHRDGTLAARLQDALEPAFHDVVSLIGVGHELLTQPCLPQQLPQVSQLCNVGLRSCLRMLRAALDASQPGEEISDARVAFLYAHTRYAEAARELNRESGAVFFQDFSPPLSR